MTSKIATITSFAAVLGIAAVSAVASPPSKTNIPPPYAADIHVSSGAPPTRDASQLVLLDKGPSRLVDAFFAYAESLNDVHDLSLERLQFALGRNLRQQKASRPRTVKTLSRTIGSFFQKQLAEGDIKAIFG